MTLKQIHKARKAFYKADYEGKRAIIQKEIDSISSITWMCEFDYSGDVPSQTKATPEYLDNNCKKELINGIERENRR